MKWQSTPVFLPGEFHGQRSLEGYSPQGGKIRQDWVTNTFTFFHIKKSVNKGKYSQSWASQVVIVAKNSPDNAGDTRNVGSIPGSRRSPGIGNGNPLQYSCLENPMDREACQATVHGVSKSQDWATEHALKGSRHLQSSSWSLHSRGRSPGSHESRREHNRLNLTQGDILKFQALH